MIEEIVDLVAVNNGIIVHTIVLESVREELNKTAQAFGVPIIDLFGPFKSVRRNLQNQTTF
ncbi:hypothetical protein GCM10027614_83340 [Micromonospora vulcania]